jgi:tetratricopeptide (TPR) repeat protein
LATIFLLQADLVGASGGDPRPILEKGLQRAEQALRLQPKMANAANVAGSLCSSLAELEGGQGRDPNPFYTRAIAFNQQAVAHGPSYGLYLNDLADGSLRFASHLRRVGHSPDEVLRSGLEAAEKSTRVSPDYLSLLTFGELLTLQAQVLMDRGEDPFPSLKKGWEALRKSEAINASDYLTFWEQGNLALIRGQAELKKGDSPAASWRQAEALIRRASGLNPKAPEPLLSSARLAVTRGAWEASQGNSPFASIHMGEEAILRGFALNPRQPNLLALRGCLRLLRARTGKGMPQQPILESAQADLEKALEQNPFLAHEFGQDLALVKRLRASAKKDPGRG